MKNFYITLIALLGLGAQTYAQCEGRYENEIFSTVSKTTVNYSDVYTGLDHEMDIYTPDGDTEINRPVIFFIHGGAFYTGDKGSVDCIDFCESFAKRGYVAISPNYRLADIGAFLSSKENQFKTVLRAISDVKSAVRYMRKDFENGDNYGIDTSTIFVGGYSAGAVLALHLAFIDKVSDLPTSPINVQALLDSIGGTLEGDAGNNGYSSKVSGVVSFAGGVYDVGLIDANDEPFVAMHGTDDLTVPFDCGPALNNPAILTLCGANEMIKAAKANGVDFDSLVFVGEGHGWPSAGKAAPQFVESLELASSFLYYFLPCYDGPALKVNEAQKSSFSLYPNPASAKIEFFNEETIQIKAFAIDGKMVFNGQVQPYQSLDVSHLPKGVYMVEINSPLKQEFKKLVVE